MIRHFKPRRIIEVGSGYSSAAILDTCDAFMSDPVDITFVEPYPETLHRCLRADDPARCRIVAEKVQDVPLDLFDSLDEHDILFIDSSHVAKFGSDLNHLLFRIIPRLRKGVVVHFHDIFRNFDYPLEWLREGRAWNEAYLVRAFLASNRDWRVLFFNDWMAHRHWTELERRMPLCTVQPEGSPFRNSGVSLWLQKVSG
jgi:predicted O-methyltransferase YrrM